MNDESLAALQLMNARRVWRTGRDTQIRASAALCQSSQHAAHKRWRNGTPSATLYRRSRHYQFYLGDGGWNTYITEILLLDVFEESENRSGQFLCGQPTSDEWWCEREALSVLWMMGQIWIGWWGIFQVFPHCLKYLWCFSFRMRFFFKSAYTGLCMS